MMRLIVYLNGVDSFVNIAADSVQKDESHVYAYKGKELVGIFDLGMVSVLYLSEKCQTVKQ